MPLRTALGAGRAEGRRFELLERLVERVLAARARVLLGVFPVLRARVLVLLRPLVVPLLLREEDVLVLREPDGEDVRVAMTPT